MLTQSAHTTPVLPLIPVVLYTRVSSDDHEDERSCDEQEADLRADVAAYAERMREPLEVIAALRDPDVPASRYTKKTRPDWVRLLKMVRAGEVRVVAFWEMPRATRRLAEWAEFAEIAEDQQIHVFLRGRMYDCADPGDLAHLTNLVIRGIEEVGQTRSRVQRSVRSQAEKGRPGGRPIFGLRSVYNSRTGRLLTHAPDEEPWPRPSGPWTPAGLVREAVRRLLAGETMWSVVSDWNQRGIPSVKGGAWTTTTLTQIVSSTSIMGRRTHKGVVIEAGGWEGVISPGEFHQLQATLSARRLGHQRVRSEGLLYFLSSTMRCGICGAWTQPSKAAKSVQTFRCPSRPGGVGGCVSRAIHRAEEHVEALVVAELSRPDVLMRFERPVDEAQVARDRERIEELRAQEQLALDQTLVAGPGRLPVADLMRIRESLGQERETLQARVDAAGGPGAPASLLGVVEAGPGLVLERWRALSVEQKRSLLWDVTDSVHLLPVGQVGRRRLMPSESVDIRFKGDEPFSLLG